MQELQRRNHSLKDESLRSRTELHCHSHVNLHLIVTDSHLFLALPRQDGTADLENIISAGKRKLWNGAGCSSTTS